MTLNSSKKTISNILHLHNTSSPRRLLQLLIHCCLLLGGITWRNLFWWEGGKYYLKSWDEMNKGKSTLLPIFQTCYKIRLVTRPQKRHPRGGHRNQSGSLQLHGRTWCWQKAEKPKQLVLPASSNCKYSKQLYHMGDIYSLTSEELTSETDYH